MTPLPAKGAAPERKRGVKRGGAFLEKSIVADKDKIPTRKKRLP